VLLGAGLAGSIGETHQHELQQLLRPMADVSLGLLLLETGRRIDLAWLRRNRSLRLGCLVEAFASFLLLFGFLYLTVGLSPSWAAATAAICMAAAPAVVMLTAEESRAEGQVTERMLQMTAVNCGISFLLYTLALSFIHTETGAGWLNVIGHPLWILCGSLLIARLGAEIILWMTRQVAKGSLNQVFLLVGAALMATGAARVLALPVFLTLFLLGICLTAYDRDNTLAYTNLPEGHWPLAVILFVLAGASLPWAEFTLLGVIDATALICLRGMAKYVGAWVGCRDLPARQRRLVGLGIQPLSATAIFMAVDLQTTFPEVASQPLLIPLIATAMMEMVGPTLSRRAMVAAGEAREG
jgi:Kef-type K+ transport system membrane component KefB